METIKQINERNREKRKKQTAEVFTPNYLINEILDKLPKKDIWKKDKTFIDPACGNGNFLLHILYRKICYYNHKPIDALKTVYGLDIKRDNIRECRLRLLKLISLFEEIEEEHIEIIFTNIRWLNTEKYPNGTLDYDFSFRSNFNKKNVEEWLKKIRKGELELVNLPIRDQEEDGEDVFNIELEEEYRD